MRLVYGPGEYRVLAIYARKRVADWWFWWVLWAPPYDEVGRDDHWQPGLSFLDPDNVNDVWLAFESMFPRRLGNICLFPPHPDGTSPFLSFPYEQFDLSPADDLFPDVYHLALGYRPASSASLTSSTSSSSGASSRSSDDDR